MKPKYDFTIIGAGFAGLATAYFLLKDKAGSVLVLEKEPELGVHASGRNASMICQFVRNPLLCEIMIDSARQIQSEWLQAFPEVDFHACGSLHVGKKKDLDAYEESLRIGRTKNVPVEMWSRQQILDYCSLLEGSDLEAGIWCPTDGVINIHSLIQSLSKFIVDQGGTLLTNTQASIQQMGNHEFKIGLPLGKTILSHHIINAAGAWVDEVAKMVKAQQLEVKPLKRHMSVKEPVENLPLNLPIVWDVSHEVYFRAEKASLMMSPCDEKLQLPGPTEVDDEAKQLLESKLQSFSPNLVGLKDQRAWSGLRTFSEDRSFVIGWDGLVPNFFWVSCLGGYGLTASCAVGRYAASLLQNKPIPTHIAEGLSPKRFLQSPVNYI